MGGIEHPANDFIDSPVTAACNHDVEWIFGLMVYGFRSEPAGIAAFPRDPDRDVMTVIPQGRDGFPDIRSVGGFSVQNQSEVS
ncbi:hypothetical protein GCM10011316_36300 [Roseibium aquae]|uniref:Uncharacterized protein n=1 Tax=Roseibium aquae TaxID=1323746 RepID=A0A916TNS7_9HYPH|nr:hypothetical protein GCM10011316_36300 [Roseibium aquae]